LLSAEKLIFMVDVPGILRDPKDYATRISSLRRREIEALMQNKVIGAGMVPKVESALQALAEGVRKVHLISAHIPHALLLEIFTDRGIGTQIIP
jgi:acetylglutamate kinase